MRERLLDALRTALEPDESVLAFWEMGSTAMGRADAMSDLDLQILVADGQAEATRLTVEAALEVISPIAWRYQVPMPSWHGSYQVFYSLVDVDPLLQVDLCIIEAKNPNRFLEPEIHGRPRVLFDKQNLIVQHPTDAAEFAAKLQKRLPALEAPMELMHPFVEKELKRNRPVDALSFYQSIVVNRLVEALRMRYCPWRYNFGLRYLQADLPAEVYAQVEPLVYVGAPAELPDKKARAVALLRATLAELKALDLQAHLEAHR